MPLDRSTLIEQARVYEQVEPLYTVEAEQLETLPTALERGEFGWRDVVWIYRWYFRRHLGERPDSIRRQRESTFEENQFEAVKRAIELVTRTERLDDALAALIELRGVDLPAATAFLFFIDPHRYMVLGEREWTSLYEGTELGDPYPTEPTVASYRQYLKIIQSIADRTGCGHWTIYRALWRLSTETSKIR